MAKSKLELDKELMFSKIMPSAGARKKKIPVFVDEDEADEIEGDEGGGSSGEYGESFKSSIGQILERSAVSAANAVNIAPVKTEDIIIYNLVEHIVTERLEPAFEKFNCCKCDRCKKDVMALALNKLRPRYFVLPPNSPAPAPDAKLLAEVNTALIQAIIRVKASPRH